MARGPIHPPVRFTSGKGDFIKKQLPRGKVEHVCVGIHNVDLFMACPAQVPGELMQEVIINDGQYSKKTLNEHEKVPDGRCEYCYDKRKNSGKLNLRKITLEGKESTLGDFERIFGEDQNPPFRIIRIAKFTESGHPIAIPLLIEFLELCKRFDVATVFPTKALPFGKKGLTRKVRECLTPEVISQVPSGNILAELFTDTKSAIYYSLGYEKMETGLVSQGFTTQWRIQQAKRYHGAKVRTSLTTVCDVTSSIKENAKQGSAIRKALKAREQGLKIRLLPLRPNSRKVAYELGLDWDQAHYKKPEKVDPNQKSLRKLGQHQKEAKKLANQNGRYLKKSTESVARFMHPDFKSLVEEGVGVCGRIGETEYCDQCNIKNDIRITFPVSKLVKVEYDPELREAKKRRQQRKRLVKGGQTLIFDPNK